MSCTEAVKEKIKTIQMEKNMVTQIGGVGLERELGRETSNARKPGKRTDMSKLRSSP